MTTEWKDITDPKELFSLNREECEIEWRTFGATWFVWPGETWSSKYQFRARPRQPKTKKVKLLAWLDLQGEFRRINEASFANSNWTRVPSEDKEIEVPDDY